MVDDYDHFEGCRRAKFLAGRTPQPLLLRADYTGRVLVKI